MNPKYFWLVLGLTMTGCEPQKYMWVGNNYADISTSEVCGIVLPPMDEKDSWYADPYKGLCKFNGRCARTFVNENAARKYVESVCGGPK